MNTEFKPLPQQKLQQREEIEKLTKEFLERNWVKEIYDQVEDVRGSNACHTDVE